MASEPSEEAIANFVSFTSTTREQAINFLKANNLDSQKAINAYFEDPTGAQLNAPSWEDEDNLTSFGYSQQDHGHRMPATAPPSRPPSRVNMTDTPQGTGNDSTATNTPGSSGKSGAAQGLSLAEREEQELQQAVAMSLNHGMGTQETGVTAATPKNQARFGKATRDDYDEGAWAMTLFNETAQEVIISPDPEDRKRVGEEPAFIRPTQNGLYLGGFLTILHEIPLAREALLLRKKLLFDYGHDGQWWNGQTINLPKIVTIHEGSGDSDWEDSIYETQRLMAFLDSTQRAFGSSDALSNIKQMYATSSDSEEVVTRFLETWHSAAIRADPDNPLSMAFMSHAYKRSPFDEDDDPISKELFVFEPVVDQDHGQTLYDVLDSAIWSDRPGEDLDDVWLEHVGDILVMKLDSPENSQSVDVKIPAVFYPDRYLSTCQHLAREMRVKKLEAQEAVMRIERLIHHYQTPSTPLGALKRSQVLEKTAAAAPVILKTALDGKSPSMTPQAAQEKSERITQRLKALASKIEEKVKALEVEKQKALETMRTYSKMLTEPSESRHDPPSHRYTLRGVCTEPHVTYLLKTRETKDREEGMDVDSETNDDRQWWRISFSTEDGKTRQAEKREAQGDKTATQNGDVVGYTARKVREIEVLKAAREEWRSVLLVYASDAAMDFPVNPAPPQLQGFVNIDNEAFATECEQAAIEAEDGNSSDQLQNKTFRELSQPRASRQDQDVNVFDYEVPGFDSEKDAGQEMQEKRRPSILALGGGTGPVAQQQLGRSMDENQNGWNHAQSDDEMVDHVEHAHTN